MSIAAIRARPLFTHSSYSSSGSDSADDAGARVQEDVAVLRPACGSRWPCPCCRPSRCSRSRRRRPRGSGSSSSMICIARTFGAPRACRRGTSRAARRAQSRPGRGAPDTFEVMCITCEKRSVTMRSVTLDRAGHADAAEVVAAEIDQHHVLGDLLGVGEHLALDAHVLFRRGAARAGTGDRPHLGAAVLEAHQRLGAGAGDARIAEAQEVHIRRRVDHPHRAVDIEAVDALLGHAEALAQHDLEDVARRDVLLAALDRLAIAGAVERGRRDRHLGPTLTAGAAGAGAPAIAAAATALDRARSHARTARAGRHPRSRRSMPRRAGSGAAMSKMISVPPIANEKS